MSNVVGIIIVLALLAVSFALPVWLLMRFFKHRKRLKNDAEYAATHKAKQEIALAKGKQMLSNAGSVLADEAARRNKLHKQEAEREERRQIRKEIRDRNNNNEYYEE